LSPILVRPVREQLEHDRIIRLLQTKSRRKFDVGMNPGNEQNAAITSGTLSLFPDLVLSSNERGKRLQAVIEVETGESVNHLEALAQWAHFGRLRAAFHLYVPSGMVEVARRLCDDNQIQVNEIWSYHTVGDEVRFTLVHRSRESAPAPRPRPAAAAPAAPRTPRRSAAAPAAKRPSRNAKPAARKAVKKAARSQKRK
jgi:pyruvate/2-oxoglutarate dehydrogenase complex dihydrolipoamide acyltransferase (E2) component